MMMPTLRGFLTLLNTAGALSMASLLGFLYLMPAAFDHRVETIVLQEVRERIVAADTAELAVPSMSAGGALSAAGSAAFLHARLSERARALRSALEEAERREEATFDARDTDPCACPMLEQLGLLSTLGRVQSGLSRLEASAAELRETLLRELRVDLTIFAVSTLGAFVAAAALLAGAGSGGGAVSFRGLATVSASLSAATLLALVVYLGLQDWASVLVFASYWGWGYTAFIAFVWLFLLDHLLLQGFVTNAIVNAIGGALSATPGC
ncbi:MAG: hypothetical protein AAF371_09380 [Pseudomonadota bacterium]